MSAILCGKRSFFDDLPNSSPISKKIRCSSSPSSPVWFSPPRSTSKPIFLSSSSAPTIPSSRLDHLASIFPDMDNLLLEKALEACGEDLDSAIKSLYELRLGSVDSNDGISSKANLHLQEQGMTINNEDAQTDKSIPLDGEEWVELFVREMTSASNMDDARTRASRALEVLEKSIIARTRAEETQNLNKENMMLKGQLQTLIQENTVLKRAVSIQHDRQREFEDKSREVDHLKQMVSQYQERLRTLEVNNYALTMHLRQAQQGGDGSIPGRFHPDVF